MWFITADELLQQQKIINVFTNHIVKKHFGRHWSNIGNNLLLKSDELWRTLTVVLVYTGFVGIKFILEQISAVGYNTFWLHIACNYMPETKTLNLLC